MIGRRLRVDYREESIDEFTLSVWICNVQIEQETRDKRDDQLILIYGLFCKESMDPWNQFM